MGGNRGQRRCRGDGHGGKKSLFSGGPGEKMHGGQPGGGRERERRGKTKGQLRGQQYESKPRAFPCGNEQEKEKGGRELLLLYCREKARTEKK